MKRLILFLLVLVSVIGFASAAAVQIDQPVTLTSSSSGITATNTQGMAFQINQSIKLINVTVTSGVTANRAYLYSGDYAGTSCATWSTCVLLATENITSNTATFNYTLTSVGTNYSLVVGTDGATWTRYYQAGASYPYDEGYVSWVGGGLATGSTYIWDYIYIDDLATPAAGITPFSVPQVSHTDSNATVSIGTAYGTVESFSFNNLNQSNAYAVAQVETFTGSGTAECRIDFNGSYYSSTTERSLSAGTYGNLYLMTDEIPVNENTNYSINLECRKVGGTNYDVLSSELTVHALYDEIAGVNLTQGYFNDTGVAINTSEQTIATFNFTTGTYNLSGTNNLSWVFDGRTNIDYANTGTVTAYMNFSNGESSQVSSRYGTAGTTGSLGSIFLLTNLTQNTTYTGTLRASISTGTATFNKLKVHAFELKTEPQAVNSSVVSEVALGVGSPVLLETLNITNLLGGSYNVELRASINVYNLNSSQDAKFFFSDDINTTEFTRTLPTTSAGQNGNVVLVHNFDEIGVGSVELSLWGYCPNAGCYVNSSSLVGFVVNAESVTTNNVTVSAYDFYNSTQLTDFNVTIDGSTFTSSGTSITVPVNSLTETITVSKGNYFLNTTVQDVTLDLNASLTPYTLIQANDYLGAQILSFTVTSDDGNTSTTTDGNAYLPLFNLTANVTFNSSNYSIMSAELTANPYLQNYTFTVYNINTIDFTFRDEETNNIINGTPITIYFTASEQSYNYTTSNGTLFAELLAPQAYTITYSASGYDQREYSFTLANQTYNELTLYLLNSSESDLITISVQDLVGASVSDATVKTQRKNLSGTNYYTVETCTSGTQGTCIQNLILYDVTYRFLVEYNSVIVKTTGDQKIVSSSVIINIDLDNDELEDIENLIETTGVVSYTNSTSKFTHTWNQPSGLSVTGCMRISRKNGGSYTTINDSCAPTDSASGSYDITINTSLGDGYTATGYIISVGYESLTDTLSINFNDLADGFGDTGLFLIGFFLIGTLAMIGLASGPSASIILVGAGVALFGFLGFINVGLGAIGGLVVIAIGFMVMNA